MSNQDTTLLPNEFERLKMRELRQKSLRKGPVACCREEKAKERAAKVAAKMLRDSNAGKRRRHAVQEVIDFLESLPEKVTADVEFVGDGLSRNEYTDGEDLYAVTEIVLTRIFRIRIFGWEYTLQERDDCWEFPHGIIFARDSQKRCAQLDLLNKAFIRRVETPDYANGSEVSDEQLRDALINYELDHGDGEEQVFYRKSEDGPLYLRDVHYEEEKYFEDMEPLDLEEAFDQFWKSDFRVYEEHDE
jgi:hypothetical protein